MNDKIKLEAKYKRIPSIKEVVIKVPVPDNYDWLLYKITDKDNPPKFSPKKYYGGKHERSEDGFDNYIGSSTDSDFDKLISDSSSNVLIEILDFGTDDEINDAECDMLKNVDAKNNPEWFNKSNGIRYNNKVKKKADKEKVWKMLERVERGEWEEVEEDVDVVFNMEGYQVRAQTHDDKHIGKIQNRIDRKGGNIDYSKPIICIANGSKSGNDIRIGGYNTIYAQKRAKHTKKTKLIRIPNSEFNGWTTNEKKLLGRYFNREDEVVKKPDGEDDAVEWILEEYITSGTPVDYDDHKYDLEHRFNKSSQEIGAIIKSAKNQKDIYDQSQLGRDFIPYKDGEGKKIIEKKKKDLTIKGKQIACIVSTANPRSAWGGIIRDVTNDPDAEHIVLLVHHSTIDEDRWDNVLKPQFKKQVEICLSIKMGKKVVYEYMDKFKINKKDNL